MAQLYNRFAILETIETEGELHTTPDLNTTLQNIPNDIPQHTIPSTKTYFKYIQITHHIHIIQKALETQAYPKGMTRQVNKLTQFIKPACPNTTILQRLKDNMASWMQGNLLLMLDHYLETKETLFSQLPNAFIVADWERACRWARNRFKQRLQESTLTEVRTQLHNMTLNRVGAVNSPSATSPSKNFLQSFPPLQTQAPVDHKVRRAAVVSTCSPQPTKSDGELPIGGDSSCRPKRLLVPIEVHSDPSATVSPSSPLVRINTLINKVQVQNNPSITHSNVIIPTEPTDILPATPDISGDTEGTEVMMSGPIRK